MATRARRFRTGRFRDESPIGRIRSDQSEGRRHDAAPNFRGRGESPDLRSHGEVPHFRDHEARKRSRWEAEKREHSRSRSRNRDASRLDRRERRSRSGGRKSHSIDRRSGAMRFEPPDQRFEGAEFAERRRRSLSSERGRPARHSSPDHQLREDEIVMNKFSPPPRPTRFAADELKKIPNVNHTEPFKPSMSFDYWNHQMPPTGPIEATTPLIIGNQGFPQNLHFGGPNLALNQPFMENQEFAQSSIINQGPSQSSNFIPNLNVTDNCQDFPPNENIDTPLIPEFNPETSKLSSFEWVRLIEDIGKQRDWKKDEKHYIMTSRLAGFARQWYLTSGIGIKRWGDLKGAFVKAFPSDMDFFMLLQKMLARTKEDNESMSAYFHHKVALLNACEIHGRKAVSCIIGGLPVAKYKHQAKAQNCEDPDALYLYLRSRADELPTPKKPNDMDEPKNKKETTPKSGKPQLCFFCKNTGHLVAQCPVKKQQKCTICFEYGHDSQQHAKNEKNFKGHNSVMHGSLSRKPTFPKYFTDIGINGVGVRGYIDQSSECTTIREVNALVLNLPIRKQYKIIRGFGGSSISSIGVVDSALCIDRAIANVKIYVVPDHIQAIAVIVGQSFTEQTHVVVMKDGDKIRFFQRMDNGETNFDF